jgi:hypothetical protein
MNPLTVLAWLKDNWRLVLFLAVLAALGVQSYRLQGAQAARDLLVLEKVERLKRDAMREAQNLKNKERTDEEYAAARRRAAVASVRPQPTVGIVTGKIESAGSSSESAVCFGRRELDEELAGFAERNAERLTEFASELARRNAERLGGVARESEEVSAAYRACRTYTLNLAGGTRRNATGKADSSDGVGGIVDAPALPARRLHAVLEAR